MKILKKTAAFCTALIMLGNAQLVSAQTTFSKGDINTDSKVSVADFVMLKGYLIESLDFDETELEYADMNGDKKVNILDAIALKRVLIYDEDEQEDTTLIEAPINMVNSTTPSVGDVNSLNFLVDFADVDYSSDCLNAEALETSLFGEANESADNYPLESVKAYYQRTSYGNLNLDGDVLAYSSNLNVSEYENAENGFEKIVMEALDYYDDTIDFSKYDGDNDGYIDALSITVPNGVDADYWYGCTATWYTNWGYSVDGVQVNQFIINDETPSENMMYYYSATLIHELGHSMGLPDYYKYNNSSDWQGFNGWAGYERMDDSCGGFCAFSKLMLGWYTKKDVQVFDTAQSTEKFTLSDNTVSGDCIILPIGELNNNYFSEYFIIEYITDNAEYSGWAYPGGVRIFHVQAETQESPYITGGLMFRYENYSFDYDSTDNGERVLRLVNDNGGFFSENSDIDYSVSGFAAYDADGKETVDTGYSIHVGTLNSNGEYEITVTKN